VFEDVRVEILRPVRRDTLRTEVRNMRERMRRVSRSRSGKFDLKQDAGGTPTSSSSRSTGRCCMPHPSAGRVVRGHDPAAESRGVGRPRTAADGGCSWRRLPGTASGHHLSLEQAETLVPVEEFAAERAAVTAIWNATMVEG
jgi:glutamate-ammonia-ligase adenylyltransferase